MIACYDSDKHQCRSLRLRGYDYSRAGAYFVTICVRSRVCLFGEIMNGGMRLNNIGRAAQMMWEKIPAHFSQVEMDACIVHPARRNVPSVRSSVHANPPCPNESTDYAAPPARRCGNAMIMNVSATTRPL